MLLACKIILLRPEEIFRGKKNLFTWMINNGLTLDVKAPLDVRYLTFKPQDKT